MKPDINYPQQAARLHAIAGKKKYDAEAVARHVGCHRNTVLNWFNGHSKCRTIFEQAIESFFEAKNVKAESSDD